MKWNPLMAVFLVEKLTSHFFVVIRFNFCAMRTIIILVSSILSFSCLGQSFEGIIKYEDQFISNKLDKPNRTDTLTLYIKNGKLRSQLGNNGRFVLLINDSSYFVNHSYSSITKDISYSPNRVGENEKFQSVRQSGEKEKIAGYTCKKYKRIRDINGIEEISSLWIADSLKTSLNFGYELYKDYGIALKVVLKFDIGTNITTVVMVKPTILDDKLFDLPDYPIKAVNMEKLSNQYIKEKK
jgi:hypothetical protein